MGTFVFCFIFSKKKTFSSYSKISLLVDGSKLYWQMLLNSVYIYHVDLSLRIFNNLG